MQRVIESLLIVGVLVNLVKGADLILRRHQQEYVQRKFEVLANWFERTRPFDWYLIGHKKWVLKRQFTIQFVIMINVFLLVAISRYATWRWWVIVVVIGFNLAIITSIETLRAMSAEPQRQLSGETPFEMMFDYLKDAKGFFEHLWKHSVLIFAGTLTGFLFWAITYLANHSQSWIIRIPLLILRIGVVFVAAALGLVAISSLFVVTLAISMMFCEIIVAIMRGITWRILEYNKGAFAAIILLLTIVLGLTELYLKAQPRPIPTSPTSTESTSK
jgi:hypothetical protein